MNPAVEREYLYLIRQAEDEGNQDRVNALRYRFDKLKAQAEV